MSLPPLHLRPPEPADTPWLWELKVAALRSYVEQTWGVWDETLQRDFFARGLRSPHLRVIELAGIGRVGAIELARRGSEFHLGRIELLPAWQGRGLGTRLLGEILDEARAAGKPVRLQVLRVNPARRLYERLGFRADGETATHVLMSWHPPEVRDARSGR
jgi:ribosomal protein S18 acetylase RimI-like enzyme